VSKFDKQHVSRDSVGYDIENATHSEDCISTVYPDNPAVPCSCGLQDALDEQNQPKLFDFGV